MGLDWLGYQSRGRQAAPFILIEFIVLQASEHLYDVVQLHAADEMEVHGDSDI